MPDRAVPRPRRRSKKASAWPSRRSAYSGVALDEPYKDHCFFRRDALKRQIRNTKHRQMLGRRATAERTKLTKLLLNVAYYCHFLYATPNSSPRLENIPSRVNMLLLGFIHYPIFTNPGFEWARANQSHGLDLKQTSTNQS